MMSKVSTDGYHNRFVKEDQIMDMFICKICHGVSREPYETLCCNNTFCKSCIDKSSAKWKKRCPICRSLLEIAVAVQIHRSIKCLDVYCEYEKDGCKWVGQVETIEKHLEECLYYPIPCEYHIVGCKDKIPRNFQIKHNQKNMKKHFILVSGCSKELNDTKTQLKNAKDELNDAKKQLKKELNDTKKQFKNAKDELNDAKKQLKNAKDKLIKSENQSRYYQINDYGAKDYEKKLKRAEANLMNIIREKAATKDKNNQEKNWLILFFVVSVLFNILAICIVQNMFTILRH